MRFEPTVRHRVVFVLAALLGPPLACSRTNASAPEVPASTSASLAALTACPEPRPRSICTHEYRPVCACSADRAACGPVAEAATRPWKEYGNPCSACSHAEVVGYLVGHCPR